MLNYEELAGEFKICYDPGDKWASVMLPLFDIAGELYTRGHRVPEHWEYRPAPVADPRDRESYFFELCLETETEALLNFGNVLNRFARILQHLGYDY